MYKCNDCGRVFEEPKRFVIQSLEHFGTPCEETAIGCPFCHGDYEDATICKICGNYTSAGDYCDDCREKTKNQFKKIMKMFFTEAEQDLIFEEEF